MRSVQGHFQHMWCVTSSQTNVVMELRGANELGSAQYTSTSSPHASIAQGEESAVSQVRYTCTYTGCATRNSSPQLQSLTHTHCVADLQKRLDMRITRHWRINFRPPGQESTFKTWSKYSYFVKSQYGVELFNDAKQLSHAARHLNRLHELMRLNKRMWPPESRCIAHMYTFL